MLNWSQQCSLFMTQLMRWLKSYFVNFQELQSLLKELNWTEIMVHVHIFLTASVSSKNFWTKSKCPKLIDLTCSKSDYGKDRICVGLLWEVHVVFFKRTIQKKKLFNLQQTHCSVSNWQSIVSKSHHRNLEETLVQPHCYVTFLNLLVWGWSQDGKLHTLWQ